MRASIPRAAAALIAIAIAFILGSAGFYKAGDPVLFAEQMSAYGITPASWSPALAYGFIAIELLLAAALLSFVMPRLSLAGTILLMVGFICVTAWAWAHGYSGECGCFGRHADRGPGRVIAEDAITIAAAALGIRLARGAITRRWRWIVFGILLVPAAALTAFGRQLPLDSVIVGLRPGSAVGDMPVEQAGMPTDEGSVLVAIVSDDCGPCADGIDRLRLLAEHEDGPRVIAVYAGTAPGAQAWRLRHLPNFRVAYASEKVLRRYYRRLPVTMLLRDGIVRSIWWNRIPSAQEVSARSTPG